MIKKKYLEKEIIKKRQLTVKVKDLQNEAPLSATELH